MPDRLAVIYRVGYALVFVLLLPALLAAWAAALDRVVHLPPYGSPRAGLALASAGLAMVASAMVTLRRYGEGLPMSPFPPAKFVRRGPYAWFAHPIYIGAVLIAVGSSLATRSGAGLWLVTPLFALAISAFVLGYERTATRERFGPVEPPLLHLAPPADSPPTRGERLAIYTHVLVPWVTAYMAVELLGAPPDARSALVPLDQKIPLLPWTEGLYAFTYLFVLLAPVAARRQRSLRRFAVEGWSATLLIIPIYLLVPLVVWARPVAGHGPWERLMLWERSYDSPATAFPAFHVVWLLIAATLYSADHPRWSFPVWTVAALSSVSCVTTGMHGILDLAGGVAAWLLVRHRARLWAALRQGAESVANSWREWDLGPVRLINHGAYAALGGGIAITLGGALAGAEQARWVALAGVAGVIGAALWAQGIEGSAVLLRPYGYFGGILAGVGFAVLAGQFGADTWLVLATLGATMPLAQAMGRLRCLVQGCCHGSPCPDWLGIRFRHPRSRVTRLSEFGGLPVHPTQLYSILWNLPLTAALVRLWFLAAPLQFIFGLYLLLTGLGRFVEEHYRGEPQTPMLGGLRLYQWLAMGFVVAGGWIMTLGSTPAPGPAGWNLESLWYGLAFVGFGYLAFGLDFPRANRRFSRLV
jgi:protein-S-isoprenylcysteine O-methyltransferase Ste14